MRTAIALTTAMLAGCAFPDQAPQQPVYVGMPASQLARPHHINRAAYGDQWVYQTMCQVGPIFQFTRYVYVRDGQVKSWQQFACVGR